MTNKELLTTILNYIKDGIHYSLDMWKDAHEVLVGKLSAYQDVYDYIENVLMEDIKNAE